MNIKVPQFQENSPARKNSSLFLVMTYLLIALRKNRFIDSLVEHFKKIMKMLNVSIFTFIILNLVKKSILYPSCYYSRWYIYERSNWKLPSLSTLKENYGTNESINFIYHCTKFSHQKSFFLTEQFLVPFIDSSSHLEEKFLKISQNQQEKAWVGVPFFIMTSDLELYEK